MESGGPVLFGMVKEKMSWLSQRQRVLAQNVANADTPDYRPRDIQPVNFRAALRQHSYNFQLAKTDGAHVSSPNEADEFRSIKSRHTYETAPGGNSVVLEEQLTKLNETRGDYQLMTSVYRKYGGMLQMALGRGGAGR